MKIAAAPDDHLNPVRRQVERTSLLAALPMPSLDGTPPADTLPHLVLSSHRYRLFLASPGFRQLQLGAVSSEEWKKPDEPALDSVARLNESNSKGTPWTGV